MKRSAAIGAAVLCALCGTRAATAQSLGAEFDRFGVEVNFSTGGSATTLRELQRAEARLHAAQRLYQDAKHKLEGLQARHEAVRCELAEIERKIAECRAPRNEFELRRLHQELEAAKCDATEIEAELSRFRNLAGEARRAAERARAEYFRLAECSPAVLDARGHVERNQYELEEASRLALDRLYTSFEWRRAESWRNEVSGRLAEAERYRAARYEIDRLRRDLAEAESRLGAMKQDALTCDPRVREAESHLAAAKRGYDELWACVVRDLERDFAYQRAASDANRYEQDAARADRALCDVREQIARLEGEINRLRGSHYISDTRNLENQAASLRWELDRLGHDVRAAADCFGGAQRELRDAQCAYDAALAEHRRCEQEGRRYQREQQRFDRVPEPPRRDAPQSGYRDRGERYERGRDENEGRRRTRD